MNSFSFAIVLRKVLRLRGGGVRSPSKLLEGVSTERMWSLKHNAAPNLWGADRHHGNGKDGN